MRLIGFSTGAIALSDVDLALRILSTSKSTAIEVSALRESELDPLIRRLDTIRPQLEKYKHVSFHAPSAIRRDQERHVVLVLRSIAELGWSIIVHPDVIFTPELWRTLGDSLCIENMDKRKPIGQTADDLKPYFDSLPEAGFCLDLGHARQVDATMSEAVQLLRMYQSKLRQVHISEVNSSSHHDPLTREAIMAFHRVAHLIPENTPVILESRVPENLVDAEIASALATLALPRALATA
ncbi:hypothetical protein Acid345_4619 [Candidatus Koribacter versatilis Ellin345]|uniref:Xylose isomerase-like TIM barrel domain-containing protein n=1 Tax=Koribacter versatilis (strain Ellin345) TaxID=204669 RepID=Q1IHN1_KORVE|nr:TIM barrel protein [Candidatus Koribacter versatilis]ABF43619.1 hypothetical protein Acid345_4619 [Candidatus Koribacter versatilis Ellin345]